VVVVVVVVVRVVVVVVVVVRVSVDVQHKWHLYYNKPQPCPPCNITGVTPPQPPSNNLLHAPTSGSCITVRLTLHATVMSLNCSYRSGLVLITTPRPRESRAHTSHVCAACSTA
jgi:hypothetical protein